MEKYDKVVMVLPNLTEEEKHIYSNSIKYELLEIVELVSEKDIENSYSVKNSRKENENIYKVISKTGHKGWVREGILELSSVERGMVVKKYYGMYYYECPNCEKLLQDDEYKYCPYCGQEIIIDKDGWL